MDGYTKEQDSWETTVVCRNFEQAIGDAFNARHGNGIHTTFATVVQWYAGSVSLLEPGRSRTHRCSTWDGAQRAISKDAGPDWLQPGPNRTPGTCIVGFQRCSRAPYSWPDYAPHNNPERTHHRRGSLLWSTPRREEGTFTKKRYQLTVKCTGPRFTENQKFPSPPVISYPGIRYRNRNAV